jgi:hypothetical protein
VRWEGHVAHLEENRSVYTILVCKPDEKNPLECHRNKLEAISSGKFASGSGWVVNCLTPWPVGCGVEEERPTSLESDPSVQSSV